MIGWRDRKRCLGRAAGCQAIAEPAARGDAMRPFLLLLLLTCLLGTAPLSAAPTSKADIREMQRLLWVLGYGAGAELDGADTPAFRERVSKFLSGTKDTGLDDSQALEKLKAAEARARDARLAAFPSPTLVALPVLGTDGSRPRLAREIGVVFDGSCRALDRYDLSTGAPLPPFRNLGRGLVDSFAYIAATEEIVCPAYWSGGYVGVWISDARTGLLKDFFALPEQNVRVMAFRCAIDCSVPGLLVRRGDGRIELWELDVPAREARRVLLLPEKAGSNVFLSADGRILGLSRQDGADYRLEFHDLQSKTLLFSAKSESGSMALSEDGAVAMFEAKPDRFMVVEVPTGRVLAASTFQSYNAPRLVFDEPILMSNDGHAAYFVTKTLEKGSEVWSWNTAANAAAKLAVVNGSEHVAIDVKNEAFYFIGVNGLQRVNLKNGDTERIGGSAALGRLEATTGAFSPDGHKALLLAPGRMAVVDLALGQVVDQPRIDSDGPAAVAFVDAGRIAVGDEEGEVGLFDLKGRRLATFPPMRDEVIAIAAAPSRGLLAIRSRQTTGKNVGNQTVTLLNVSTGKALRSFKVSQDFPCEPAIGFTADGRQLLFGDGANFTAVDVDSGRIVLKQAMQTAITGTGKTSKGQPACVGYIVSADGTGSPTYVSAASGRGPSVLYEYGSGKLQLVKGNPSATQGDDYLCARLDRAAVSPQGLLATAILTSVAACGLSADGRVQLFDQTRAPIVAVGALSGKRFATIDKSGELRVYGLEARSPLLSILIFDRRDWLAHLPDGSFAGTDLAVASVFAARDLKTAVPLKTVADTLRRPDALAAVLRAEPAPASKPEAVDQPRAIPAEPTHVALRQTQVRDANGAPVAGVTIPAGTLVRVIATSGELSEVARAGKAMGFVHTSDLTQTQ